jgi:AcrR family transcriptional regulator
MARKSARSEEKRAEILRRAADLFRRKGFFGSGMREIADAAGMTPGALYYYFESKEDLLYACQKLTLRRLLWAANGIVGSDDAPGTKLRALVTAHLRHALGELGGSFAHVEFHALDTDLLADVVAERDRYEACWRQVLGEFESGDPKLQALTCLGALNWAAIWWRPDGPHTVDEVADSMVGTLLMGVERVER